MTDVPLQEHLEKILDLRFEAHHEVHEKADKVLDSRLDRLNELRELVGDIQSRNVSREYFDTRFEALDKAAREAQSRISTLEGRFLGIGVAATMLGAAALVVSLVR